MCEALRELMKEEIEEELKKNREQAIQQGLAQGLQQGIKQGVEQGVNRGRIEQLIDLVKQNLLPIETAAQCAKMTLDEFKVVMEK